jgi:hypothetical protein
MSTERKFFITGGFKNCKIKSGHQHKIKRKRWIEQAVTVVKSVEGYFEINRRNASVSSYFGSRVSQKTQEGDLKHGCMMFNV